MDNAEKILNHYRIDGAECTIIPFGSGLINHTYKVTGPAGNYVLQQINTAIFKNPQFIANNLTLVGDYLKKAAPEYLFAAPLQTADGGALVEHDGKWYRLSPFINGSHTVDFLTKPDQAYEAAKQFGRFTALLDNFDVDQLQYPLPDFHNLSLRVEQYKIALSKASKESLRAANNEIALIDSFKSIGEQYEEINHGKLPLRVIHHDTKINNVLFDDNDKGLCVIDLDTVMPGYFISDVGDMMRTYLAEANEEEQDLDKITIRDEFFKAIYKGYMDEMGSVLTSAEKDLFIYSGKFMIYMQALRFLTDFLNGDIYYQTRYPGHNLSRAKNQLRLLTLYCEKEATFQKIIQ